jgi:hypothetical protein
MILILSEDKLENLLERVKESGLTCQYEFGKHRLDVLDKNSQSNFHIRLPIHFRYPDLESKDPVKSVILLIQSGHSALGFMNRNLLLDHKVFSAYMVRKKQGLSQVKYLKTKGKSRAGSRLRLANTTRFFENINLRLQNYFEKYTVDRIALSCSKTLLPFLFNSKVSCPFKKKDERIFKIPRHIHRPNFNVLQNTRQYLLMGEISFESSNQSLVDALLASG